MSKRLFPWLFLLLPLAVSPALSETLPPRPPIDCAVKDNVEDADCQKKLTGLFTRKGDALTLKLDGGKSKTYTGNRAACDRGEVDKCVVYRMRGYYPSTQSYLIQRAYYEGGAHLFVSRRSGSETEMPEVPQLSPNAKYLISIDQNDTGERDHDIAIWSMQTDPPKLEFAYKATQYENWEVKAWKDDTHLSMTASINGTTSSYDQEAELVRNPRGWTLVLGKKTEHR